MTEPDLPKAVMPVAGPVPPERELVTSSPSPRDILVDAIAAILLIICAFIVEVVKEVAFGGDAPWSVAAMLFVGELTLLFGFVLALLSTFTKVRKLARESGIEALVRGLIALRPDLAVLALAGRVFRNAAAVGAGLGILCGGIALSILLIADASSAAKQQWFFYGLYAVIGGTLGVVVSVPIDRAIIKEVQGSACLFSLMFSLIVVGGLAIWLGLGFGLLEQRLTVLRAVIQWVAPTLAG